MIIFSSVLDRNNQHTKNTPIQFKKMKFNKSLYTFLFSCLTVLVIAQSPPAISYQGIASKAEGKAINNQTIDLRISIQTTDEMVAYQETHKVNTSNLGLFKITIGKGAVVAGSWDLIEWGASGYWTKIEVDEERRGNYRFLGMVEFLAVPIANFALRATQGYPGPVGPPGPVGVPGPMGVSGLQGQQGMVGPAGPQGPPGPAGAGGATQPQCPQGPARSDGEKGPQGPQGPQGEMGADGFGILPAQATPPIAPVQGEIYMDDGTNRANGTAGLRQFDGTQWIDI